MKNILKIAILSMVLINCSNNDNNNVPTTFEPQNIDFINIGKGHNLYYRTDENENSLEIQKIVFTNSSEWNVFLSKISNNEVSKFTETDIDFTTYQVIVIIDSWRPSYGWYIDINTITELENEIKVKITSIENEKEHLLTVMTQPYHIVKIPKTDKNVVLDDISVIVIP